MPLLARTIQTPLTIEISSGAIGRLGSVLADARISNGDAAVVLGPGIGAQVTDIVHEALPTSDIITITAGTWEAASELADRLKTQSYDAVVGIGGGRVLDTVKYAAMRQGMPMVAVATSLAHDGLASPVSTLTRGSESISYGVHIPIAVIVDLALVAASPIEQIRAGIGDELSNLSAVADWQLSHDVNGEKTDGLAMALAVTGAEAVLSHPGAATDEDFLATLANALIQGGVAMAAAGTSRPCSGACHEIWHATNALHPGLVSHGAGAGLGALFATFLRAQYSPERSGERDLRTFHRLNAAFARHQLPRVPGDVGLSTAQFADVVSFAPSTRPGRYTILEHLTLDAGTIVTAIEEYIDAVG